jgi:hypothetical protein
MSGKARGTVLPVILPAGERLARAAMRERSDGTHRLRLRGSHGWALLGAFVLGCGIAQAQSQPESPSILDTLWKWTPLLARGFVFNLAISFIAMAIGTVTGLFLGFAQISLLPPVREGAWFAPISSATRPGSCCSSTACSCCRSRSRFRRDDPDPRLDRRRRSASRCP